MNRQTHLLERRQLIIITNGILLEFDSLVQQANIATRLAMPLGKVIICKQEYKDLWQMNDQPVFKKIIYNPKIKNSC